MTEEEICKVYLSPDKGKNYISKDKIRDKIKELEEELNRYYNEGKASYNHEYTTYLRGKINTLYDLLEE